jgi:predicted permease
VRTLRQILIRLTSSITGRRDEARLREELEDHLAMRTDEHLRAGLSPDEARRQAVIDFGAVEAFKESYRDQQSLPVFDRLLQDVRLAIRRMRSAPAFTAAAVATLALGLGLTSAVLSLAYALFLKPLALDDASRLVIVDQTIAGNDQRGFGFSMPDYVYFRDRTHALAELAAHYSTSPMLVATRDSGLNVSGSVATASYFKLLRLQPVLGRFFSAEEDEYPGKHPVAVVSHHLWQTRFAGDAKIIGTMIRVNGTPFTVIGVAPEGFRGIVHGTTPNDVWIPTAMFAVGYRYCDALARGCPMVNLIGRLDRGATIDQAQVELDVLARQIEAAVPGTNTGRGVQLRPARGIRIQEQMEEAPMVALLSGAATLVLLVASANVAGLLLARGLRRRKEIAIRLALGASRARLVRMLLVESVALAAAGGAAGLVVAFWSIQVLHGFFGVSYSGVARNLSLSLDPRVVLVSLAVAIVTGIVTGLAPALQATRPDRLPALREETPGAGGRRSRLREGLIVMQVAVSALLLASSGLLVRSFLMLHRGPGFDPDAIVLVRMRPSLVGYTNERAWTFQREALRRFEALPGVVAASPGGTPPLPRWLRKTVLRHSRHDGDQPQQLQVGMAYVGPHYFKAMSGQIVGGRDFDDRDRPDGARVAIVNEILARRLWPKADAVGDMVQVGRDRLEVVGVVNDPQILNVWQQPAPMVYFNYWQQNRADNWSSDSQTIVRISGDAAALVPQIERTIAGVDPDVPFSEASTLGRLINYEFSDLRAARALLLTLGTLALVLSAIGVYAALVFAVTQRRREMAIRIALGASETDVGALVVRRGAVIVAMGLSGGLAAAASAGPFLASLLYGVSPRDPLGLLTGPAVLAAVAVIAIWLPARRAMAMDPMASLRSE